MKNISPTTLIVGAVVILGLGFILLLSVSRKGQPTSFERDLIAMAEEIGLDGDQFYEDYKSENIRESVDDEVQEGEDRGVSSTPTVYIEDQVVQASPDFESFKITVESFLDSTSDEDLPIRIDVYEDYQCPFCADFFAVPYLTEAEYGDKVLVVHYHFPLDSIHPRARRYAYAAEAAKKQNAYFEMSRAIFSKESGNDYSELDELGNN